jgi:hypothetical protein
MDVSIWNLLPLPHPPADDSQLMIVLDCEETGSVSTAVFQGSLAWKMLPVTA